MTGAHPPEQPGDSPAAGTSLAERIDHLFGRIHPRGRGEYSLEEVVAGMRQRRGVSITTAYLSQLRKGQRTNPSIQVLEALADFFGVSASYFFDTAAAESIVAQVELYTALRDAEIRDLALRASDLSPASIRALAEIIEHWRQLEGLPTRQHETRASVAQPEDNPER